MNPHRISCIFASAACSLLLAAAAVAAAANNTPGGIEKTQTLSAFPAAQAAHGASAADGAVRLEWTDSTRLRVAFPLTVGKRELKSDYSLWLVPRICGQKDTLALQEVVFRGRLNRKKAERSRYFHPAALPAASYELAAGDTLYYETEIAVDRHPWLRYGALSLCISREKEGCCRVEEASDSCLLRSFAYLPPFVPTFSLVEDNTGKAGELARDNPVLHHISECRDYTPDRILRKEHGALYVHFQLDKIDLLPDFKSNAATLDKIVRITRDIFADTTSRVVRIQIIGLASPEGSVRRNLWLGQGRAEALKQYIRKEVPQAVDELFDLANGGEAWAELRDQIRDSDMPRKDEVLRLIDGESDPDRRERALKQFDGGAAYRWIRDHLLSDQRNSGYISICYDYKPDRAARTINKAIPLISLKRYDEALRLLRSVQTDPRSHNALGSLLYLMGQDAEAEKFLREAAGRGEPGAAENLRNLLRTQSQRKAAGLTAD